MPASRPILFSAELVRAILGGSKTVTRRVVLPTTAPRLPPEHMEPWMDGPEQVEHDDGRRVWTGTHPEYPTPHGKWFTCPYGGAGDRLYVREAFRLELGDDALSPSEAIAQADRAGLNLQVNYEADGRSRTADYTVPGRLRPSIHMPARLSRITLEVTEVSVERVQDTTRAEAVAEGVPDDASALFTFSELWDGINAGRGFGWATNPWVWRVAFTRVA